VSGDEPFDGFVWDGPSVADYRCPRCGSRVELDAGRHPVCEQRHRLTVAECRAAALAADYAAGDRHYRRMLRRHGFKVE
jgi:DNA-directed RNA polymerase subunit RPC12/RpoP